MAAAMHPVHWAMFRRVVSSRSGSGTTSVRAKRSPGRSTLATSRRTRALSVERLVTQLEITTSTESSGSRISSMWPLEKPNVVDAGFNGVAPGEGEHLTGDVEPVGLAVGS